MEEEVRTNEAPEQDIEEVLTAFDAACQAHGLKRTVQRREIYKELLAATDHPSAETVYQRLHARLPALSRDTVFRALSVLARHGIIAKIDTLESVARYEALHGRHHHIVCRACGQITDFTWPEIDALKVPQSIIEWGELESTHMTIHGWCAQCRQARQKSPDVIPFSNQR